MILILTIGFWFFSKAVTEVVWGGWGGRQTKKTKSVLKKTRILDISSSNPQNLAEGGMGGWGVPTDKKNQDLGASF